MKTARQSFGREPYNCLKEWNEDTFCQCGGNGLVLPAGELEKAFIEPESAVALVEEVVEIKAPSPKSYRTAFFEAFPKNPSCFIRGEGRTIEEAEAAAWSKWEKITACSEHVWERRNRTDGYAYCTKCPLSGSFLEPETKCAVCNTPTKRRAENLTTYHCIKHYLELPVGYILYSGEMIGSFWDEESQTYSFEEDKLAFHELANKNHEVSEKFWEEFEGKFTRYRAFITEKTRPLLGTKPKSKLEVHEEIKTLIPRMVEEILIKMKERK